MSGNVTKIDEMTLHGTKDGQISISTLEQPYGPKSETVVSIGISLQADSAEPDWKVHIPASNIDAVISALQKAQKQI
ncbi:MAG: hypothetical protein Q9M36_11155 [Sulfurovum sp.]|nr:hypothetical protein [Sulfurovum sp.]